MLGVSAYAENADIEADVMPSVAAQQKSENTSMPWSLLAGESLNDVARLFYPKNKAMQQVFVKKALYLSRYIQPELNPNHKAAVDTVIVIPNIKFLTAPKAKKAAKLVKKSTQVLPSLENIAANAAWQEAYDSLVAKNEYLKQEIERLNEKLAQLLDTFAELKTQIIRLLSQTTTAPATQVTQTTSAVHTSQISTELAPIDVVERNQNSWYLLLPILSMLFVMGLFFILGLHKPTATVNNDKSVDLYTKFKHKYGRITKKLLAKDKHVKTKKLPVIFSADFPIEPVAKSEYSGSMIVTDLSDVGIPNEVDEKELSLEQAQIYVDINREDVAIKLLKQQIKSAPKAAIQHWLLLLDIYRKNNQKAEFMQYAKLLHEHFNVMMPSWDDITLPAAIATSLEQFEHISKKMTALWENCEKEAGKIAQTKQYLDELLLDNRGSERAGFSLEVFKEIMLLRGMLEMRQKLAVNE